MDTFGFSSILILVEPACISSLFRYQACTWDPCNHPCNLSKSSHVTVCDWCMYCTFWSFSMSYATKLASSHFSLKSPGHFFQFNSTTKCHVQPCFYTIGIKVGNGRRIFVPTINKEGKNITYYCNSQSTRLSFLALRYTQRGLILQKMLKVLLSSPQNIFYYPFK